MLFRYAKIRRTHNEQTLPILTALFTASAFAQAAPQTLDVYTYDSFSADWSAGPKVKAAFEQQFPQCKLNYVAFDNNGTLFNRVRLEGKKIKADVVLGLDSYQIEDAQKLKIFEPNKVDLSQLRLPIKWENHTFLPLIMRNMRLFMTRINWQTHQRA